MNFFKKAWCPRLSNYNNSLELQSVSLVSVTKFNDSCYPTQAEYLRRKSIGHIVPALHISEIVQCDTEEEEDFDYDIYDEITNSNTNINRGNLSNNNRTNAKVSNVSLISRQIGNVIRSSDLDVGGRHRSKSTHMVPLLRVAPWAEKTSKNRNYRSASMELVMRDTAQDSEFVPKRVRSAVSVYVLDHLMLAKRIELLENMYGGKFKAHRSATIIQRYFRNYQIRKLTKRICSNFSRKHVSTSHSSNIQDDHTDHDDRHLSTTHNQYDPDDPFLIKDDEERKRWFYLGVNLFNRNSNKGIKFLINHGILEAEETTIVRFFDTKGLSSYAKGEYMSQDNNKLASATRREYISKLSFHNCSIEKGVRKLFSHIRVPGETQKILNMVEEFNSIYLMHNTEFRDKLTNPDTVVMIAFAILMLHTSLFNPSARKQDKMTKVDFVKIFRDYTKDPAIEENYFDELYDNIKRQQIKPLSDHTDLVRDIYNQLVGPKIPKNFVQNYRKLVCHYQLNEIQNIIKKPTSHCHRRELFIFNDLILITKKTPNCTYNVRHDISLFGIFINGFKTKYYTYGVEISQIGGRQAIIYLDCFNDETRKKLMTDISIYIEEMRQIDELRLQEEVEKVYLTNKN